MRLVLFEPDIPQNAGAMLRLAACLGVEVDIVEPCGFLLDDKRLRRVGMDYLERVRITRHRSWSAFQADRRRAGGRLVLLTREGEVHYNRFAFAADDLVMVGRESAGVPADVHRAVDARVRIPLAPGLRSLNVAQAAAIVLAEGLRQTALLPRDAARHAS